jgi:hypothetical protein
MVGTGIVFRPLVTPADRSRAYRLLDAAAAAYRSPRLSGDERWSGLWDLTASDGAALAAAGATYTAATGAAGRPGACLFEVRAVVAPVGAQWPALMGRVVRELADAARAEGAGRMVAAPDGSGVLGGLGFRRSAGWWVLDL